MAKLNPSNGGCWFCYTDDENEELVYDDEFDTNVHKSCIREALKEHPQNNEALLMKYLLEE